VTPTEHPEPVPGDRFSDTDTPTAIEGVEIAVFEGEAVLFDETSSMLHRLGAIAGAVWLCCDGVTDVAAMTAELADVFVTEPSEIAAVVRDTLDRFADLGLLVGHDAPAHLALTPEAGLADDGTTILNRPPDP
jgi:hypothetical protein